MNQKPCMLTDQLKLEISIRITDAFLRIHYGNLIVSHNQLSPDNVHLDLETDDITNDILISRLVLADFYSSTIMEESSDHPKNATEVGGIVWNPYFVAPEQKKGEVK